MLMLFECGKVYLSGPKFLMIMKKYADIDESHHFMRTIFAFL